MYGVLPKLTKKYILDRVSEEAIFEHYFRVAFQIKDQISSPVRTVDNTPSFGFYYAKDGRAKGRDLAGYFWGDCFDAVAHCIRVNANTNTGFMKVLEDIAKEFSLHKFAGERGEERVKLTRATTKRKEKPPVVIHFKKRHWIRADGEYWIRMGINKDTLTYFDVIPAQYVWINNQLVYAYNKRNPAYVYYWGRDRMKVYFPARNTNKFIMNCSPLEGVNKLRPSKLGIVTKSYKDVMTLFGLHYKGERIAAISPPSEAYILRPEEVKLLNSKWDTVLSLMDYDKTGIHNAWILRKEYGIQPMFLSDGLWRLKKGYKGAKDISDYVMLYGKNEGNKLINQMLEK